MKTRNLLAVLASAFMLTACNNESPDTYPNWYPDSYIIGFEGVENLDASALHLKFFNLENKTMDIAVAGKQELPTTLSIIGNIMQMDFHVRYDVDNSVLSFQPADCESLQGNAASASAPLVAKFQGIVLLAALHLIFCMLCSS